MKCLEIRTSRSARVKLPHRTDIYSSSRIRIAKNTINCLREGLAAALPRWSKSNSEQLPAMDFFGRMLGFAGAAAVPAQIFDMGLKTLK